VKHGDHIDTLCKSSDVIKDIHGKIADLLSKNSKWFYKFLKYFPVTYFRGTDDPGLVCQLLSVIKYMFDIWGKIIKCDKLTKYKKILFKNINDRCKKWMLVERELVSRPKMPKTHFWYHK